MCMNQTPIIFDKGHFLEDAGLLAYSDSQSISDDFQYKEILFLTQKLSL